DNAGRDARGRRGELGRAGLRFLSRLPRRDLRADACAVLSPDRPEIGRSEHGRKGHAALPERRRLSARKPGLPAYPHCLSWRPPMRVKLSSASWLFALAFLVLAPRGATAEAIKIGLLKTAGNGGIFVALARGYFAAEGLQPTLTYFTAAQPIAVAVVSGDIDFGSTALTGGLYNLAAQGSLRVIAAQSADMPTFQNNTVIVSNRADAAGLKSYQALPAARSPSPRWARRRNTASCCCRRNS